MKCPLLRAPCPNKPLEFSKLSGRKMIPFIVLSMTAMKISAENPEDRERQKQLRKELNPKWLVAVSPFAYLNDTIEIAKLYANTDLDIKRSVAICPLCNMAYEAVVRNRVKKN
jgi:hypothetical protein